MLLRTNQNYGIVEYGIFQNLGRYIAPAGTPTQMLSLPYDKIGQPTTILQVQQSVEVLAGRVAPWFGQIGGGIQYQLGTPLDQLISEGIIKIFGG